MTDPQIRRAAALLAERYGIEAMIKAGQLLDTLLDPGDLERRQIGDRLRRAIIAVQAPPSAALH